MSSNFGLFGFAIASVLYLVSFQAGARQKLLERTAFSLFVLSTALISLTLVAMVADSSLIDISGILLTVSLGWIAVGGHIQFKMKLIGALVAPLATFILLMQFFVAPPKIMVTNDAPDRILVLAHVTMAIIGQAFAIIACAVSVLYLWQQNLLKKKLLTQLSGGLPAIDRLERLLMRALWTGFIFITLGLLSGAVMTQSYNMPAEMSLGFKVIWATFVWVWYLATLLARNVFNRSSKRVAQMSLAGFLFLSMTYFGMGFFRTLGGA
jgi:ABC-type uncharacterized transport system permease subunit